MPGMLFSVAHRFHSGNATKVDKIAARFGVDARNSEMLCHFAHPAYRHLPPETCCTAKKLLGDPRAYMPGALRAEVGECKVAGKRTRRWSSTHLSAQNDPQVLYNTLSSIKLQ